MEIKKIYPKRSEAGTICFDIVADGLRIDGFRLYKKEGKFTLGCPLGVTLVSEKAKKDLLRRAQEALNIWFEKDIKKPLTAAEKLAISQQYLDTGLSPDIPDAVRWGSIRPRRGGVAACASKERLGKDV